MATPLDKPHSREKEDMILSGLTPLTHLHQQEHTIDKFEQNGRSNC